MNNNNNETEIATLANGYFSCTEAIFKSTGFTPAAFIATKTFPGDKDSSGVF
jgi:hypothetical protein